jgi:ribonuclease HI
MSSSIDNHLKQHVLLDAYYNIIKDTNPAEADYILCVSEYIKSNKSLSQVPFIERILKRVTEIMKKEMNSLFVDPTDSLDQSSHVADKFCELDEINSDISNNNCMSVFCEGTSINIGTAAARSGCGIYINYMGENNESKQVEKNYVLSDSSHASNQRAELTAIYMGLADIQKIMETQNNINKVSIFITSKYTYNCMNDWGKTWSAKGWKRAEGPIMNVDIIKPLYEKIISMPYVTLKVFKVDKKKQDKKKKMPIPDGFRKARELAIKILQPTEGEA